MAQPENSMTNVTGIGSLNQVLADLDSRECAFDSQRWYSSLEPRKRAEAEFHDWTHGNDLDQPETIPGWEDEHPNMKFYAVDRESARHRERWIQEHAPGRVFVDYACGRGTLALIAAEAGAAVSVGIDISPVSVENARKRAQARRLPNARFIVADCEHTGLPDHSIDRIIAAGCLHHLDLRNALPEIHRILKPGGRLYAIEALAYNPVIQLYRRLTPHLRTSFEKDHILSLADLRAARKYFRVENVIYFHLASIATVPLRKTRIFERALTVANAIDRVILKVPPISYMAWSFSFELVKSE